MIQSLNQAVDDVSNAKAAQKVKERHLYPLGGDEYYYHTCATKEV